MYAHWRDSVDLGGGGGDGGVTICGHGQGVMRTQPFSLAGGLDGEESNGRGCRQAGPSPWRRPLNASLKADFILQPGLLEA